VQGGPSQWSWARAAAAVRHQTSVWLCMEAYRDQGACMRFKGAGWKRGTV
jgi:hypothetical protein